MADYYTQASFIIDCSSEQAQIALDALDHINDQFTDYADAAVWKADNEELCAEEKIIRHCFYSHPDQEADNSVRELCWDFQVEATDGGLWVHSDGSINTEHAAVFTQAVLMAFNLPELVEIEAAHTCSKDRTDAFGGHACVVSKDFVRWGGLDDFIRAERNAHKDGERFLFCQLAEVNGQCEYASRFLIRCSKEDDPQQKMDDILESFRGDGCRQEDNSVLFECGTVAMNPRLTEITPHEFTVMQKYLSVL